MNQVNTYYSFKVTLLSAPSEWIEQEGVRSLRGVWRLVFPPIPLQGARKEELACPFHVWMSSCEKCPLR